MPTMDQELIRQTAERFRSTRREVYILVLLIEGRRPEAIPFSSLDKAKAHVVDFVVLHMNKERYSEETKEQLLDCANKVKNSSNGVTNFINLWRSKQKEIGHVKVDAYWDTKPQIVL